MYAIRSYYALRIFVSAGSHTLRPADRRDMDIPLLPNEKAEQYRDLGDRFPGGDRYPGFTGFLAARMAAYYGYGMTGITDPTDDLDVIELHDAFTISDVQTYEDVGIRRITSYNVCYTKLLRLKPPRGDILKYW